MYRRSQYSPEVDQQERAAEEQYIQELEERGQECSDELRPDKRQKQQKYQQDLEDETFEGGTAAGGKSIDPRGDQVDLLQSETSSESDTELDELGYRRETVLRQSYVYDSSSEDQQQELDEPEQSKLDGTYEATDVSETN